MGCNTQERQAKASLGYASEESVCWPSYCGFRSWQGLPAGLSLKTKPQVVDLALEPWYGVNAHRLAAVSATRILCNQNLFEGV